MLGHGNRTHAHLQKRQQQQARRQREGHYKGQQAQERVSDNRSASGDSEHKGTVEVLTKATTVAVATSTAAAHNMYKGICGEVQAWALQRILLRATDADRIAALQRHHRQNY